MNEKTPSEVKYRKEYADHILDELSPTDPVMLIGGNVDGDIYDDNRITYVRNLLVKRAVERKDYDMVIYYDAANKNAKFGDEMLGFPKSKQTMSDAFGGLNIAIASDGGQGDALAKIFEDLCSKGHADAQADQTFFTVLERIANVHGGVTFCVIINNGHTIFPDQSRSSPGAAHSTFPERLEGIAMALKGGTKRHVIVLDNHNEVSGSLLKMIRRERVPSSTRAEMEDILKESIKDRDVLIKAIRFAVTVEVSKVMSMVKTNGKNVNRIMAELIELRTKRILQMSDGLLHAKMGLSTGEVALSPAMQRFCKRLIYNVNNGFEELMANGVILQGPPGTGKSIAPSYIASILGIPYMELRDLGTDGLAGRSLEKIKKVFDTLEENKPCILLIDEIDKLLPSGSDHMRNNNDDQVRAYFLSKLADDRVMRGIMVFATTNEPGRIDEAMLRSGRFETRIPILPPKNPKEKAAVFKAVWNQIITPGDSKHDKKKVYMCDDETLDLLLADLPDYITGGDLKKMIKNAISGVISGKYPTIWEAFISLKRKILNGEYIPKFAGFDQAIADALALKSDDFDDDDDDKGEPEYTEDDLRSIAMLRWREKFAEEAKGEEDKLTRTLAEIQEKEEKMRVRQAEFDTVVGAGFEDIKIEKEKLDKKMEELRAEEARIQAEREKVQQSRAGMDEGMAEQMRILRESLGEKFEELCKDQLEFMASCSAFISSVGSSDVSKMSNEEIDTAIAKINEILSKIALMKVTVFGMIKKKELDELETLLNGCKNRIDSAMRPESVKEEPAKGSEGTTGQPRDQWWDGSPYSLELPALPPVGEVDLPQNNGRNSMLNTLRSISRTTEARIVAIIIGLSAAGGLLYYNRNGIEKALEDEKATIITFESAEESISKGYVVLEDGVNKPVDGYGWAYSPDEIEKFPENDPRRFAVIKLTH